MKVGYVRVSTREQNTARQDELMKRLGVEKVYTDRMSGKDTERPELRKMMDFVREGDSVTVESISRFARSTKDLLSLMEELERKGVQFVSQKESIDTSTPTGKFILTLFAALAELERKNILERQAEGIAIAKAEGRMNGRPKKALTLRLTFKQSSFHPYIQIFVPLRRRSESSNAPHTPTCCTPRQVSHFG